MGGHTEWGKKQYCYLKKKKIVVAVQRVAGGKQDTRVAALSEAVQ